LAYQWRGGLSFLSLSILARLSILVTTITFRQALLAPENSIIVRNTAVVSQNFKTDITGEAKARIVALKVIASRAQT